jgi:pyruvate kinase
MNHWSHTELVNQVRALYLKVINQAALLHGYYPTSHHQYSAYNLMAFLAYKKNVNSDFISALRMRGLCLSSIQHVVESLQIICSNLGIIPPVYYTENPQTLLKRRRAEIFGTKLHNESPHIMLTLDAQMVSSTIIEEFLNNGMTIARINCAYNDESTWVKMIESIRHAEDQLRKKGQYGNQKCRIYMDLAGPKIRVGPIKKTAYPLKISVKKNVYGQSIESKKGFISPITPTTKLLSNSEYDFEISITPHDKILHLKEGDYLTFLDMRNNKRKFLITKVLPSGLKVNLDQTAYIDENTKLQNAEHQIELYVVNLEKKPVRLLVKKSDRLRIYLDETFEGHYDPEAETASISVSLPKAFTNIKKGHLVFIDDGKIQGIVKDYNGNFVDIEIIYPDSLITLKENKGINLPDSSVGLSVSSLTRKDEKDLEFICRHADMVGISFVHSPHDLRKLKQLLSFYGKADIPVIAKIETKEAINNFSNLLLEGLTFSKFGVMVARGDLAINVGFQQLSVVQEEILSMCRAAHIPVILATQVLDTLAKKGIPSRSELADLSVGSEFDCIMLNKGLFMREAIKFLQETLFLISEVKNYNQTITRPLDFYDKSI